jgi:magnesium transporter
MYNDLENIRDALLAAEPTIFSGSERRRVEVLSGISRELIDFKQTARIHRDIWDEMTDSAEKSMFGKEYGVYIDDIKDEFNRIHELIVNARELLADLRDTNDSLLNTRQNEIIKVLTLVAFIFYPLTFIASIFTIPSPYVPLVSRSYGWPVLMLLMVALALGMWLYFRKKKWLS